MPAVLVWRNLFTGEAVDSRDRIRATELFRQFPVCVLVGTVQG